ncbi:MAG TPA: hypothetical protein P5136_00375 [Methanofastidiosum sp.]|nr:hypothetical protein [Methanofastidiosum sp.]
MKINSNTVSLEKEDYKKLEDVISKVASANKIDNVEEVHVALNQDKGIITFKKSEENTNEEKGI